MRFADELLEQAYHLLNKDGTAPNQASLRRAVSTAYYALFHLLIDEAVGKWSIVHQRSILARTFEHGSMVTVCELSVKSFYMEDQPAAMAPLKDVAQTFSELRNKREIADYDNSTRLDSWSTGGPGLLALLVSSLLDAETGTEKTEAITEGQIGPVS